MLLQLTNGQVGELVDPTDLKSVVERRVGSSPSLATFSFKNKMKFRILETHNPKAETTMYTVQKAYKGWFGIGTMWSGVGDEPLSFRGFGGDWCLRRFISIKDAEAAIEKYKQVSQPIKERVIKEL